MSDPNTTDGPSSGTPRDPSDPQSGDSQYSSDATQPTPAQQPPITPDDAAFAAGETAPWPAVDPSAAGATMIAGAASGDAAAPASVGGPEPWEAPEAPGAASSAALARGVSSGKPQPTGAPGSSGKPVAVVAGVIGAAIAVAAGAWFFLLDPSRDTASASPTPAAIVTPGPTATVEPTEEPTVEPTDEPTPEATAFRAPRFTGRTVEEADALAAAGGLELRKEFDDTSSEPDGMVLEQDPPPGAAVRPGDTIVLTIARSGPTVLVPDLVGQTEDDGLNLLLDADLVPGERTEAFDELSPEGTIVSTDPGADEEVERQSSVDYVVSVGPEPTPTEEPTPAPVAVPDLRGIAEEDAVNQLLDLGLEPGERSEAFDEDVEAGAVISTEPTSGVQVAAGTTIDYTVSQGPEPTPTDEPTPAPVAIPDLRGIAEADALNRLLDLGLTAGDRTESFSDDIPAGSILSTDPSALSEVRIGTAVAYVVSQGPEPTPTPAPVVIPDLRGLAEEDAVNQLLDLGLTAGDRTESFSDDIPAGSILSTDPSALSEVRIGTAVAYVVSQGPEPTPTLAPVVIPDLRGLAEEDAVNQLLDLGLTAGDRGEAFDEEVEAGAIVSTDPSEGIEVTVGTPVAYTVSLGVEPTPTPEPTPAPVAIPDLRGLAEEDAVNQLLDLGLTAGDRTEAFSDDVAAGSLLSTDPSARSEVAIGTAVAYTVSKGPEPTPTPEPTPAPVVIPDLRDIAEADAVNQLLDLDLVPGDRTEAFSDDVSPGAVVSTDPSAGTEVTVGTAVAYTVSKGPEPTPTPEPTPAPVVIPDLRDIAEADAVNQLLDLDLVPGDRTEAFSDDVSPGAVVSTDPSAGTEVTVGTPVAYTVSLGVEPTPTPEPTPPPVAIPDLRGIAEEDAVNQLLDLGLTAGDRTESFDPEIIAGAVVSTDPSAGSEVTVGTPVAYTVSQGPEPTPTPEPTPAPVVIPDLRGVAEEDAVNQLLELGLAAGDRTERFHGSIAQGAVIRTDPEAGAEVAPGTSVAYVVSQGPEPTPTPEPTPAPVAIPDLRGIAEEDAVNQLLDLGLAAGDRSESFDGEVAAGAVISTDPSAGTEVTVGTPVAYTVSLGVEPTPTPEPTPAPVVIPDLRGVAEEDAVNQLLELGLTPGDRTERFHDSVPEGAVTRTDPPAGAEVDAGTSVAYVVSQGPEPTPTPEPTPAPVAIPDLRGVAEEDAVSQLLDAGLEPGTRRERFHDSVPVGALLRTEPASGTEVPVGTVVDYFVSKGPEPTPEPTTALVEVPNLRGFSPEDAVSALLDANLTPGERQNRFNDNVDRGQVIRTEPAAGERVDAGTTVDYFVSRGPQPTDEPTPEPTQAPTPERTASTSSAQATIDEIGGQVETIRELDAREEVPYREISRAGFRREIEAQFDEENPARRVAAEEAFLKRMGLIPRDMDLRETLLDLYESQVAAFYDPQTGAMTVIGNQDDIGAADRLFISHEYDHALQDQYWDLEAITDVSPTQGDRALARLSLIEGDATNVMYQWAFENLGADDISELADDVSSMDQDLLNDVPAILRRQLEMPYLDGQAFVAALRQSGGWDAVNAAWDALPASTEQILHPERYPDDRPARIELPDVAAALGDGWSTRYTQTLGELGTRVLLADGGSESDVAPAADGWGGDRLVMLQGPDDTWAIVWQTAWDSEDDAQQFVDAAGLGSVAGVHTVLPGADVTGEQDAPVLVLVAKDDATLAAVQDALGVSEVVLQ